MHTNASTKYQAAHTIADGVRRRPAAIDYVPAVNAMEDLVRWAMRLAVRDVSGWPEGRERVHNVRRYLVKSLRGRPTRVPNDDLLFTAGLLARIFESELRLPLSAVVEMLGEPELPTEVVPRVVSQPTPCCGPVRRYPTPPPRTAEEEDKHWRTFLRGDRFDHLDDSDDELRVRRVVRAFERAEPLVGNDD